MISYLISFDIGTLPSQWTSATWLAHSSVSRWSRRWSGDYLSYIRRIWLLVLLLLCISSDSSVLCKIARQALQSNYWSRRSLAGRWLLSSWVALTLSHYFHFWVGVAYWISLFTRHRSVLHPHMLSNCIKMLYISSLLSCAYSEARVLVVVNVFISFYTGTSQFVH